MHEYEFFTANTQPSTANLPASTVLTPSPSSTIMGKNSSSNKDSYTKEGISTNEATINLCKAGIETTLLFMPYMFSQCGFMLSTAALAFAGLLTQYSWSLMLSVLNKLRLPNSTLTEAVEIVISRGWSKFSDAVTYVFNFGTNITLNIFILDVFKKLVYEYSQNNFSNDVSHNTELDANFELICNIKVVLLMLMIFLPFSMKRNLEQLSSISLFGLTACFIVFLVVITGSAYKILDDNINIDNNQPSTTTQEEDAIDLLNDDSNSDLQNTFSNLPMFFGVIFYLYDANGILTNIRGQMKNPIDFSTVVKRYILIIFSLATIIGGLGSLAFGQLTNEIIIINLQEYKGFKGISTVLNCLFSISILVNTILYSYPIIQKLDSSLNLDIAEQGEASAPQLLLNQKLTQIVQQQAMYFLQQGKRIMVRLSIFLIQVLIALQFPDIQKLVNLLGCVFSVFLGFIMPFLLYTCFHDYRYSHFILYLNFTVLGIGMVAGVSGFYVTLNSFGQE